MASQQPEEAQATAGSGADEVEQTDGAAESRTATAAEQIPESKISSSHPTDGPVGTDKSSSEPSGAPAAGAPPPASEEKQVSAAPALTRQQTEALGPAVEDDLTTVPTASNPALNINLMLTTGAKHPYKIDERYLSNRNAAVRNASGQFDPKGLTGYKLKELIWTDWRKEWEPRPASPSSIRLITMGKMIDDKKTLNDYAFDMERTNVVHMTVKPADFGEDEEAAHAGKGGSIRARDGGEGGAGCRCVIL